MWYYTLNNQQVGPVEEAEIRKLVDAGSITHGTMVWTNGMANWLPIGQTPLASLLGSAPPPVVPTSVAAVYENPEVTKIKSLFMWFWISLIGTLLFGLGLVAAAVLFFIIFHKAWKLIEHEGIRANADQATAGCFIPGWNFYWVFPAFRGLARELRCKFDRPQHRPREDRSQAAHVDAYLSLRKLDHLRPISHRFRCALDHVHRQDQERRHRNRTRPKRSNSAKNQQYPA